MLTLGRQTICADSDRLQRILDRNGIGWDASTVSIDQRTVQAGLARDHNYVTDETLFNSFCGGVSLDVMDVTDYEGANIVHDLCKPIPEKLKGRFDVIFNGSVLDNIFDPAQAMRNISQLLTPSGRVVHVEMASNLAFEYLMYSPDWFLDYYVVNGYADCRVYICTFKTIEQLLYGPWEVFAYMARPDGQGFSLRDLAAKQAVVVTIAEKRETSRFDVVPVQWVYRDDGMKAEFARKLAALDGQRPVFGFGGQPANAFAAIRPGGFVGCGTIAD